MTFATFQAFEAFRLLAILRLFDDFFDQLANSTINPIILDRNLGRSS